MGFICGEAPFGAVGTSEGVRVGGELAGDWDWLRDFAETVGAVFSGGFDVCVENCYDREFLFVKNVSKIAGVMCVCVREKENALTL